MAQYSVLIAAYLVPAVVIAGKLADIPIPQVSFGSVVKELNALQADFGLSESTVPFQIGRFRTSSS